MRRLIRPAPPPGPSRAARLSVLSLMLLLLPLLALTTSPEKQVALGLGLADAATGGPAGPVEDLRIRLEGDHLTLTARVLRVDVRARDEDADLRTWDLPPTGEGPDLAGLQAALRSLARLDPSLRATLVPADGTPTRSVVALLDAARADAEGPLVAEVSVGEDP